MLGQIFTAWGAAFVAGLYQMAHLIVFAATISIFIMVALFIAPIIRDFQRTQAITESGMADVKNERCIIVHPSMGVFVGHAMGLAFFSLLDSAGQTTAPVFNNFADARGFLEATALAAQIDEFALFVVPTKYAGEHIDSTVMHAIGVSEEALAPIIASEAARHATMRSIGLGPKIH